MVFCGLAGPHGFRGLTPVVFYGFCGLAGPVLGVTGSQKKKERRRRTCVRSHLACVGSAWMRSVLAYAPELAAASARPPLPLVSQEDEGPSEW